MSKSEFLNAIEAYILLGAIVCALSKPISTGLELLLSFMAKYIPIRWRKKGAELFLRIIIFYSLKTPSK